MIVFAVETSCDETSVAILRNRKILSHIVFNQEIHNKFGGVVPIPGDTVNLNASDLLSQAKEEQNALRDELKTILDEMTYDKLVEKESTITENVNKVQEKIPLPVFVG